MHLQIAVVLPSGIQIMGVMEVRAMIVLEEREGAIINVWTTKSSLEAERC